MFFNGSMWPLSWPLLSNDWGLDSLSNLCIIFSFQKCYHASLCKWRITSTATSVSCDVLYYIFNNTDRFNSNLPFHILYAPKGSADHFCFFQNFLSLKFLNNFSGYNHCGAGSRSYREALILSMLWSVAAGACIYRNKCTELREHTDIVWTFFIGL